MKKLLFTCISVCSCHCLFAQQTASHKNDSVPGFNIIKFNVGALIVKNYSFQYERILNKHYSVALGFRFMPKSSLPFEGTFENIIADNDNVDTKNIIKSTRISNVAFTPEFRWYLGKKGYGRGFYIAPFYRYANYSLSNITVNFENANYPGLKETMVMSGKQNTNTGGVLIGAQWYLGKHIAFDWWILGPNIGYGSGEFSGNFSRPLTQQEQDEIKPQLDDIDIPLISKDVTVNANGADVKLHGTWAGVRAGLSLGVMF